VLRLPLNFNDQPEHCCAPTLCKLFAHVCAEPDAPMLFELLPKCQKIRKMMKDFWPSSKT